MRELLEAKFLRELISGREPFGLLIYSIAIYLFQKIAQLQNY